MIIRARALALVYICRLIAAEEASGEREKLKRVQAGGAFGVCGRLTVGLEGFEADRNNNRPRHRIKQM